MRDRRIDEIQPDEDEYFVYLRRGYCLEIEGQHCFGVTSRAGINVETKRVIPCHCKSCTKEK